MIITPLKGNQAQEIQQFFGQSKKIELPLSGTGSMEVMIEAL